MIHTFNDEWSWEGPDPSVGIFGSFFIHDCYKGSGDEGEVIEQLLGTIRVSDVTVRDYILLTCTDCAKQRIITQDDYSPSDEAVKEMEGEYSGSLDWSTPVR